MMWCTSIASCFSPTHREWTRQQVAATQKKLYLHAPVLHDLVYRDRFNSPGHVSKSQPPRSRVSQRGTSTSPAPAVSHTATLLTMSSQEPTTLSSLVSLLFHNSRGAQRPLQWSWPGFGPRAWLVIYKTAQTAEWWWLSMTTLEKQLVFVAYIRYYTRIYLEDWGKPPKKCGTRKRFKLNENKNALPLC
jgi:hypothetical protein